jgi:hypothetical protein
MTPVVTDVYSYGRTCRQQTSVGSFPLATKSINTSVRNQRPFTAMHFSRVWAIIYNIFLQRTSFKRSCVPSLKKRSVMILIKMYRSHPMLDPIKEYRLHLYA